MKHVVVNAGCRESIRAVVGAKPANSGANVRRVHVLFLCSGNVCRSPIAERLTRAFATEHELPNLTAESAGTRALVGFPIEPVAARVIEGLGGDVTGFKARRLRADMIGGADLILAMTEQIRDHASELVPDAAARAFTLGEAHAIAKRTRASTVGELAGARRGYIAHEDLNISDPVGLSAAAYERVGEQIAATLLPLLRSLGPGPRSPGYSAAWKR